MKNRGTPPQNGFDYELLDSGEGHKLERFGARIIARPSSLCIWKKLTDRWREAHCVYAPGEGWRFSGQRFDEWEMQVGQGLSMRLRLQRNGQLGVFPEHAGYLPQLLSASAGLRGHPPRVLNLFAFTGLASLVCMRAGAEVTHVDTSKQALAWAKANFELNGLDGKARLIAEDAVTFLRREKRRGKVYDVVIADPPNFSRISRSQTWELDRIVIDLIDAVSSVLGPGGVFFITCHQSYGFAETVGNLLYRPGEAAEFQISSEVLALKESASPRRIPAGIMICGRMP